MHFVLNRFYEIEEGMLSYITGLLVHYGYIVLYVVLSIEIIALPTPGETLMTYCGFLVSQGKLDWKTCILVATLGVITGVTISYTIGRTIGFAFFKKFGKYIHLGPDRLEKASKWFSQYGDKLLFITFFVPGVRHVTGHLSGITRIPYKRFALKAYIGAFLWTSTFISLGKILGSHYERLHGLIGKYLIIVIVIIFMVILIIYLYKNHKKHIIEYVFRILEYLNNIFHSLGKIKLVILGAALAFVGLSVLVIWLIDAFLDNEFIKFNRVINILVNLVFANNWSHFMKFGGLFTSIWGLAVLSVFLLLWIVKKGLNKSLEIHSFLIVLFGGIAFSSGMILIFNHLASLNSSISGNIKYKFPDQQSFMAVVLYGYAAFIIMRHAKKAWFGTITCIIAFDICLITGASVIFFQMQHPSDVLAGYIFGGIWLSINIVILEVFRILPRVQYYINNKDE